MAAPMAAPSRPRRRPVDGVGADQADSSGGGGIGVALGGVGAVLALCCVGGFVYYRRRKRKQHEDFFIGAMIAESDSNKGNKGGSGADLRALARRGSKRKTAIGCNVGGEAMSIVHVKGDSQPAPPPATTSSERIYPLGRGASTLDAQQQADWVRRRSSIRKQLSSGAMGGEAPPRSPRPPRLRNSHNSRLRSRSFRIRHRSVTARARSDRRRASLLRLEPEASASASSLARAMRCRGCSNVAAHGVAQASAARARRRRRQQRR